MMCTFLFSCILFSQVKAEVSNSLVENPNKTSLEVSSPQQDRQVTGVIKDKKGETIIGANIMVKGTTNGAVTDVDGRFTISNVPGSATLVVTYIGYISQEVAVGGRTNLTITLDEDTQVLNEVVVVGYGTQKKGEITSSITSMKASDFNKAPVVNPMQLVEGRVAGLTISRVSTDPNATVGIQMRGASSISGNNQPLIIIDGIPGNMTSLNAVAPEDIEAIDVLKDGSAAAIYGTRGNNGVIIVSTKRPQVGVSQVEYSGYIMHETVYKRPDILTGDEFADYGRRTGSTVIKDFGGREDAYDLLLNKDNISHVHNLTASGGTSEMNYRASLNYKKNEGIALATNRETINGSLAVNHWSFNRKLLLSFNISNSFIKAGLLPDQGAFYEAIRRNPTIPIHNADGSFYEDYGGYEDWNPVARSHQRTTTREYKNLLSSFKATYEIISGLKTSAFVALENNDESRDIFFSRKEYTAIKEGTNGRSEQEFYKWANRTFEWTADYNAKFANVHNLTALLGYSFQDFDYERARMQNQGYLTDAFGTSNMTAGSYLKQGLALMESDKTLSTLIAFFARANYNYDGKYLASLSLRREGSSKFGANYKWAYFPSVSLGWMISKEGFMQGVPALDMLKLRVGYGVTGSLPNDPYMSLIKYGTGYGYWDAINGKWLTATYGPGNNPNPNLKWEKNKSLNIGFDFGLFNDRISGTIDWYQRTTSDLIGSYTAQTPALIYSTIMTNVGTMRNRGFELAATFKAVQTRDFTYTANLTFAYEQNELTSLSNDMYKSSFINKYSFPAPGQMGYAQRLQEGHPVGSFYGFTSVGSGIDANGHWTLKDLDGVEGFSEADRSFIGNGLPKIKAGLQNSFTYKNFDFSFFLRGMFDYDILNEGRVYFGTSQLIDKSGSNVYKYALDQKLVDDAVFSTYFLEKGDFLKIDNVTLGYTFKLNNKNLKSLRLYGNVTNLATITGYKGLTPDINVVGIDEPGIDRRGVYPITRTFSFGLNFGF
ncbi:SusC/RagA family TonB-linked outer membrane protein [Bacteroidia bacterium]|nr:SusC/RagA family TonB-linked outer membrane protein [Bacteroidia bacterium]